MTKPDEADIERILLLSFPTLPLLTIADDIAKATRQDTTTPETRTTLAKANAMRAELRALPAAQVRAMRLQMEANAAAEAAAQKRARHEAAERARFYHQPGARADFALWLGVDSWTVDEAAALLLDRDPRVVNSESLARDLEEPAGLFTKSKRRPPSEFHLSFDQLRLRISRADRLAGPRLRAIDVVAWAQAAGIAVPSALLTLTAPSPATDHEAPDASGLTAKRWTPQRREELQAYRDKHGTRKAAAKFGISESRVRKVLEERAPERPSPFPYVTSRGGK